MPKNYSSNDPETLIFSTLKWKLSMKVIHVQLVRMIFSMMISAQLWTRAGERNDDQWARAFEEVKNRINDHDRDKIDVILTAMDKLNAGNLAPGVIMADYEEERNKHYFKSSHHVAEWIRYGWVTKAEFLEHIIDHAAVELFVGGKNASTRNPFFIDVGWFEQHKAFDLWHTQEAMKRSTDVNINLIKAMYDSLWAEFSRMLDMHYADTSFYDTGFTTPFFTVEENSYGLKMTSRDL